MKYYKIPMVNNYPDFKGIDTDLLIPSTMYANGEWFICGTESTIKADEITAEEYTALVIEYKPKPQQSLQDRLDDLTIFMADIIGGGI